MIEHPFYSEPTFWGFLTAVAGAIRYLMRVQNMYRLRADRALNSYQMSLIRALDQQVKEMKPVVEAHAKAIEEHTKIVNAFQGSAIQITDSENRITRQVDDAGVMMKALKTQFSTFQDTAFKQESLIIGFTKEIESIRTEILQLKKGSGNVFVTTKKP